MNPSATETTEALLREGVERLREAGSETARLDAELLLGHALGVGRTVILAHPEAPVGFDAASRYRSDLDRRAAGEPVAYLRGLKEFFGLAFSVDRRALIPRPETERLVELAEAEVVRRLTAGPRAADARPLRIVDVGTGSGAIAVTLAVRLRGLGALAAVEIDAVDISPGALDLARENAVAHAVAEAIAFDVADLLPAGGEAAVAGDPPYDLILANLPYVRHDAIAGLPVAASFEPALALDGGPDGLAVISRLLEKLPEGLADGGLALLEIGGDQGEAIVERCRDLLPGWACDVIPDLAGLPRVARVKRV
ncbi:MAG: release factor glutamine methyltransferase [Chloroflexota bacterium]|nr:release factor glutamine methyltransferase [Chloroflexota bacterium]